LLVLALLASVAHAAPADRAQVEAMRAKLVKLGADQASGEGRASLAREKLATLNAQEQALASRIAANRATLGRLLSALQLMSRDPPPPLLVSPRKANDAVRAAILMRSVEPVLQQRAAELSAQAKAIAALRREAALQNTQLMLTESELAERRAAIATLARRKGALEESLDPLAQDEARAAQTAAQQASDPAALVRNLAQPAPAAASAPLPAEPGMISAPVTGQLVRRFGQAAGGRSKSEGMAWRTEPEAQVRAPAAGRVDYAGPLKGWGQVVVLKLSEHVHVVLTGLSRADTAAGRSVAAGEPIGVSGRSRNPAPEIYLEMRRDGAPVDPSRRLDARPGA
jgi:septal ring factor EnvC (AmiA/AmiB activator)